MLRDSPRLTDCPDHVAVIGGGRWARVMIDVLYDLLPPSVGVSVHSLHNANSMSTWVSARGWERRIDVSSALPQFDSARSHAVIVVTAARDHEAAAKHALSRGVPALVEKPIALSASAA